MSDSLKLLNNGVLPILSGKVDIMDPSYKQDVWCAKTAVSVLPGNYVTHSYYSDDLFGWGKRNAILQIVHEDYHNKVNLGDDANWEELGKIGVDSGMCSFTEAPKPDFDDNWIKFCNAVDGPRKSLGTITKVGDKAMLVSRSGIGDGYYPVFALRNEEQNIFAVEVRFTTHVFFGNDEEEV